MRIVGKFAGDGNGFIHEVKDGFHTGVRIDEKGKIVIGFKESYLTDNIVEIPADRFGSKGQAVVKEVYEVLSKIRITSELGNDELFFKGMPISKTALHKIVDYVLFDGDLFDLPEYIRDLLF